MNAAIRSARDEDAGGLIELIDSCFAEYPGCVLDVDGEEPELRAPATAFERQGGGFWVAHDAGRVVGCVGLVPATDAATHELRKLYVARPCRRRGLAGRLCGLVESIARARGAKRLELWSDTRFAHAHAFYARLGFCTDGRTRELHDRSRSVERYFSKSL